MTACERIREARAAVEAAAGAQYTHGGTIDRHGEIIPFTGRECLCPGDCGCRPIPGRVNVCGCKAH